MQEKKGNGEPVRKHSKKKVDRSNKKIRKISQHTQQIIYFENDKILGGNVNIGKSIQQILNLYLDGFARDFGKMRCVK